VLSRVCVPIFWSSQVQTSRVKHCGGVRMVFCFQWITEKAKVHLRLFSIHLWGIFFTVVLTVRRFICLCLPIKDLKATGKFKLACVCLSVSLFSYFWQEFCVFRGSSTNCLQVFILVLSYTKPSTEVPVFLFLQLSDLHKWGSVILPNLFSSPRIDLVWIIIKS